MTTGDRASQEHTCKASAHSTRSASLYIGLGSNVGDREANLLEAQERIRQLGVEITRASSVYETEPVGYADQPWFLNQVIETRIAARLTLGELLRAVHEIESEMGRKRTIANGPRVIDIDLLIYSEMQGFIAPTRSAEDNPRIAYAEPILPHPRLHLRRFVLEPLCEIAPDLIITGTAKTCSEMLSTLDDPARVRIYQSSRQ